MERFGRADHESERRIEELKATRIAIKTALSAAQNSESQVRLHSTVEVSIESRAPQSV